MHNYEEYKIFNHYNSEIVWFLEKSARTILYVDNCYDWDLQFLSELIFK